MNYQEQLEDLFNSAVLDVVTLISRKGEESDHTSDKCLKIKDDELMYNLDGGRYLTEVHRTNLVDNSGYMYSFSALETEKFMEVADHLIEIYNR